LPEPPHPLALELAAELLRREPGRRRTLLVGLGTGRNVPPLLGSGAELTVLDDDPDRAARILARLGADGAKASLAGDLEQLRRDGPRFDAALSTHGFLHGTAEAVRGRLAGLASLLASGAPCRLTLGAASDPRFGDGLRLDAQTWAPADGPEAGVPHAYFDREQARAALAPFATAEIAQERGAAGAWAHDPLDAERIVHWFVRAVAR
jgi:hypothetical protein